MKLTQEELKRQLHYDPETGIFTWKVGKQKVNAGSIAGHLRHLDYRYISINRKLYYAHRLAFLYMKGYFPENDVDHINRVKHDNRWENLREVSRVCNVKNCGLLKNNTSKITGVTWNKINKNWVAQISINNKNIYLGSFKNKLDAAKTRWNAEVKNGWPNCNTTSSAYLYILSHKKRIKI